MNTEVKIGVCSSSGATFSHVTTSVLIVDSAKIESPPIPLFLNEKAIL